MPTRRLEVEGHNGDIRHNRALLVVGMAPGYHEDVAGKSWVGWSGELLGKFIRATSLPELADVYLSNSLRCHVKAKQKPTKTQINKCRPNLMVDMQRLLDEYEEVVILACGADASRAVAGVSSLGAGLKLQGFKKEIKILEGLSRTPTLFFTYHPAILYPGRKPEKVSSIQAHFMLLRRYLTGEFAPNKLQVLPELGAKVPKKIPPLIVCDIETYGILEGYNQTVFTPAKSKYVDGVPYGKQIVTVSFAYRNFSPSSAPCNIRTPVYVFSDYGHQRLIREWFKRIIESGSVLQGQNFKYDLLYLIMNGLGMEKLLDPNLLKVDDTLIKSFLLDESQPEKGLKELSLLLGITNYQELEVTGSKGNAKNPRDPNLLYYNCMDSAATLMLGEEIDERIKGRYGDDSPKLGEICAGMRNDIIWSVVGMEKAGGRIDIGRLQGVDDGYKNACREAMEEGDKRGVIFGGLGSRKSKLEFIFEAVQECGLQGDKRVERTKVKKEISVNKSNVNLLLQYLPEGHLREVAIQLQKYDANAHIRSTYTRKMLTNNKEGIVYRRYKTGWFYPVWYPVPSVFEKGGTKNKEKQGGTIQGRITARKPPAQTFPSSVLGCLKSRFPAGTLRTYDFSRIELVVPAFLSGDPPLLKALKEGNPHVETTLLLFPHDNPVTVKKENPDHYILGKSLNFLVQYRGGPDAYQRLAKEYNVMVELDFCREAIKTWWRRHPVLRQWQDDLIETVMRKGYLELPTGWSRTFGRGTANAMGAVNEICNFPIQTLAAQLVLSGQFMIMRELRRNKARAVICNQTYDSITVDTPYDERGEVDRIVDRYLTNPPLAGILEDKYGRSLPLRYEMSVT